MLVRPFLALGFAAAVGLAACGARTGLGGQLPEDDAAVVAEAGVGARTCVPDCTVGHDCCAGSCSGPAVALPSDCCTCLPGEVSTFECGHDCGK